jgi:pimeloyl-ACP methyl ester carboxylesterase
MKKSITYCGCKIYYDVMGEGSLVILIHGFGEDSSIWSGIIKTLKDKYTIITPDLPGTGESSILSNISIEEMAEVIHEIIHAENIESCPIIGHSMGGYIALALLDKYANHISGLGLFHSTAYADSEEKKAMRKKGIEFIKDNGSFAFLKTTIPNLFSTNTKAEKNYLIDEMIGKSHNFSTLSLVSYYEAMLKRPDRTAVLNNTDIPVLFMIGKNDNAIPIADVLQQCHLPEKVYIHILQNSGHMGMIEEEEISTNAISNFLRDVCYK